MWRWVALLTELRAATASTPVSALDTCGVAKAAEKAKAPTVDVLRLILGQHLVRVGRVDFGAGIAGLSVDPVEVRKAAWGLIAGLAPIEAFRRAQASCVRGMVVDRSALRRAIVARPARSGAGRSAWSRPNS